ncbi:MAG: hypothetical protein IPJ13_03175 [Saprospiraceae bacterium]|nr:hypothetical protein [Saprospiraceae bacterium]
MANLILAIVIFFAVQRQAMLELPAIFSIRCEQLLAVPSLLSKVFYSILVTTTTLEAHLDGFEQQYGKQSKEVIADAGYGSEENYEMMEQNK